MNGTQPILIVGAGAVGLTLACELRRQGVDCRVIDQREGTTPWSKAIVVHARTMEIFARMGLIDSALARGRMSRGAVIRAFGKEILHLGLDDLDAPYNFFLDIDQSDTEAILFERLQALGGTVEWKTRLTALRADGSSVNVRLQGPGGEEDTADYAYVCACDGAHSFVRHALGLPFPGASYEARFFLADVHVRWDRSPDHWYADIQDDGLFFAAALRDDGRWRIITEVPRSWTKLPETLVRGESPTEDDLQAVLARMAPQGISVSDPIWMSWFQVSHRILDDFRSGRVFFCGDAAHIHAPVGGQGMNIGIHDAFNLGWKLPLVLDGTASDRLLDSYNAERRPAAQGVVDVTDTVIEAVLAKGPVKPALAMTAARVLDRLPLAKRRFERIISEIDTSYRGSPIVGNRPRGSTSTNSRDRIRWHWEDYVAAASGPQPGDRAPDGRLKRTDGAILRLHEVLTGTGFHILYFVPPEGRSATSARDLLGAAQARLGRRVSLVEVGGFSQVDDQSQILSLRDDQGRTRSAYKAWGEGLFLIRPDGHVGFRCFPADAHALNAHIERMLAGSVLPGRVFDGSGARNLALACVFGVAGVAKIAGTEPMRKTFARYGYGDPFMRAVGTVEILGAAALVTGLAPRQGAVALAGIAAGAVGTHAVTKEPGRFIGALALLGLAGAAALMNQRNPGRRASRRERHS